LHQGCEGLSSGGQLAKAMEGSKQTKQTKQPKNSRP
jgi:hypothetical protein